MSAAVAIAPGMQPDVQITPDVQCQDLGEQARPLLQLVWAFPAAWFRVPSSTLSQQPLSMGTRLGAGAWSGKVPHIFSTPTARLPEGTARAIDLFGFLCVNEVSTHFETEFVGENCGLEGQKGQDAIFYY